LVLLHVNLVLSYEMNYKIYVEYGKIFGKLIPKERDRIQN